MQASLPKLVRMISVEDIGQGSEPIRILGIKWLPRAAAKKSVTASGRLEKAPNEKKMESGDQSNQQTSYQRTNQSGQDDSSEDINNRPLQSSEQNETQNQDASVAPGMEAEEGDFFNLEIAFAYKTSRAQRKVREKAKNMHIYLAFYLPGNIKLRKSG